MTWQVLEGDCIESMRAMPDASADAVVTDPPYGLSAEPDTAEVLRHWLAGAESGQLDMFAALGGDDDARRAA
jgi:DNA modification methylase